MKKRALGRSGIEVAPLAFGGNVFGWTVSQATAFQLLDAFVAAGFELIDTADMYSRWVPGNRGGESETSIGRWTKQRGNRDKIVIATKVGKDMGDGRAGLSKAYIASAVNASLQRLQTDYIDLYQAHADDANTPLEETLEAFDALVRQGKVRALGASNYGAGRFAQALDVAAKNGYARYETLQPLYNLYDRSEYESAAEPLCLREQIGVISYYSLASGFLTGKYRSERDLAQSVRGSGVHKYLNARGMRILATLDDVSRRLNATAAAVAIAWLIARPSIAAPIASATSAQQLDDLIAATRLTLDADAMRQLEAASAG